MNFEIKFIPEAEETFGALASQLRQKWGDNYVIKLEDRLLKVLKSISINPYSYPIADENNEIRKCILHKNCSMLYRIDNDVILIVCFWDNRQDPIIIS